MQQPDLVNSPPHYNKGEIECIDAMAAMSNGVDVDPHTAHVWQTAFKYLWRWPSKGRPLEDLKKCRWYLDRTIARIENQLKEDA